jgi:lysophospholipase L1-like esterase
VATNAPDESRHDANPMLIADRRPLPYLALGDSYTVGERVPAAGGWPQQLVARLRRHGVALDRPRIIAVTGWTTDELAAGMDAATLAPPYALVSLQIGVNNQYRGRAAGQYRGELRALLQRAVALAGGRAGRVVVVSIPDWGVTRFGRDDARGRARIGGELDVHNAIARDEVGRAGARWVDITGLSRRHPELLADDGLHPSAAQYARWVEAIEPVARAALR